MVRTARPKGRGARSLFSKRVSNLPLVRLPWVSLGDEPFGPEGWDGDQAVKAGGNAPQAPLDQGGEGSGRAPGSAMAGFFSARVVRWTASHMPVDTAQNSASAMIRMSRSSRPASLI